MVILSLQRKAMVITAGAGLEEKGSQWALRDQPKARTLRASSHVGSPSTYPIKILKALEALEVLKISSRRLATEQDRAAKPYG